MASNLVQENDQVVFMRHGSSRVFQVRKNRQVYFEKNKFHVEELIGQPYGTTYEIQKGNLVKVDVTNSDDTEVDANVSEPSGDNRNLLDLDSNQKMSREDIMKLKGEGLTGEEIIEELIENSETFQNKTEFSKAKYLKKKKKKHILRFTVLRPTPRLVMDIYTKDPGKICNLRPDTLSQLLNYSNVMYGSHVAVVETCHGLVLSSVLQRLGGNGKLLQLVPNNSSTVNRQVMDYFSFSKEEMNNVYSFPMDALSTLKDGTYGDNDDNLMMEPGSDSKEGETSTATEMSSEDTEMVAASTSDYVAEGDDEPTVDEESKDVADVPQEDDVSNGEAKPFVSSRLQQRIAREARQKEAAEIIHDKKLDSLIIACKYNPLPIVQNMLQFLAPSKHVVVFCQFIDPLVSIYTFIKESHQGLQIKLSETWLREYQVLPQRTHPKINMSGTGGYLLTFITCDPTKDDH